MGEGVKWSGVRGAGDGGNDGETTIIIRTTLVSGQELGVGKCMILLQEIGD